MIEQIHGTGLSGITGKTTSHSKNSLFAALMGMLEKHTQGSGKGVLQQAMLSGKDPINKGLRQQAMSSGKSQTGKGKSLFAMSEKGDSLTAKKHDQLLALAAKGKHKKKKVDVTAIPVIANHVISDLTTSVKKTTKTAAGKAVKTTPGFSSGQVHSRNKQASPGGQVHSRNKQARPGGQAENRIKQPLQNEALPVSAKAESSTTVEGQLSVHLQDIAPPTATRTTGRENPAALPAHKSQVPEAAASVEQALAGTARQIISNSTDQSTTAYAGSMAGTAVKAKHISADAASIQPTVKTKLVGTPVHIQQSKNAQLNRNSANISTVANMTADVPVTLSAGSDSHTSNSGNREDGSNIQILSSDTRSGTASLSSHTQFQQYMSDKAAPSMTLFDSMQHIAQSAKKGKSQLEIQLEPANLGKIQISLQSDAAKQLHVHIIADQSATRQLIDQQLPQLKNALAQQGFDLSGFSMGSEGQHTSSGGDRGQGKHAVIHTSETAVETVNVIASPKRIMGSAGLSIRI